MAAYNYTAFMCAHFVAPAEGLDPEPALVSLGWEPVAVSARDIAIYKHYFYPEFVDFSLGAALVSVSRYRLPIGQRVMVDGLGVDVVEAVIYHMPFGMMLYSIRVDIAAGNLDDITRVMAALRSVTVRDTEATAPFSAVAISLITEAFRALGGSGDTVIESGNKFKLFQIAVADTAASLGPNPDNTLFELATLSKIGGCSGHNPDSPSRTYIDTTLGKHRLSYFNNWSGLALNDTFTILASEVKPWVLGTWIDDYFSMIYMHALFSKFYLFRLNTRFREHPELGNDLEDELNEMERTCMFHRISYNFLPEEVNGAIDRSLQISEERKLLAGHIAACNRHRAEMSTRRLDHLITFLTFVTIFSTIWDFSCMVRSMLPTEQFDISDTDVMRLTIGVTFTVLLLIILHILRRNPR